MKKNQNKFLAIVVALIISGMSSGFSGNNYKYQLTVQKNGFAVVELFTSEGCSSCPPADDAVADLQKEFPDNVFVLGFHVDYWDRLGWQDMYSNKAYTERQSDYANAFSLSSIYTPQVVVNGENEFVGSNKKKLQQTVESALNNEPKVKIILNATNDKSLVTINYRLSTKEKSVINFALVELNADTDVKRGENSGRKLHHINVVRDFKTVEAKDNSAGNINFIIPPGLTTKDIKLIVYLQEKKGLKITGVSALNF